MMHGPKNVKFPNNISEWQMGFNSAFKGLSKNFGLGAKRIQSLYNILVHWKGADFKVVVVKFMIVFVTQRDSACS
jgi:hypothetical protein